jgi:hypothetical protein
LNFIGQPSDGIDAELYNNSNSSLNLSHHINRYRDADPLGFEDTPIVCQQLYKDFDHPKLADGDEDDDEGEVEPAPAPTRRGVPLLRSISTIYDSDGVTPLFINDDVVTTTEAVGAEKGDSDASVASDPAVATNDLINFDDGGGLFIRTLSDGASIPMPAAVDDDLEDVKAAGLDEIAPMLQSLSHMAVGINDEQIVAN